MAYTKSASKLQNFPDIATSFGGKFAYKPHFSLLFLFLITFLLSHQIFHDQISEHRLRKIRQSRLLNRSIFGLVLSDDKLTVSPIYACEQMEVAFVGLQRASVRRIPMSLANSMALLFSMTNSLCLLLILSHQIRRWRKFWKHIIYGINLPHHLQQEKKSGKRKIARCAILKFMDGGQAKPRKLGNLLLGEIASQSVFLESYSQQTYQFRSRIFI